MNSRQRRTWKREISTEGGRRRKRNQDRRFAIREEIWWQRKYGSPANMEAAFATTGWRKGTGSELSRRQIAAPVPMKVGVSAPPGYRIKGFTARYDDDNGVDQGWHRFEVDDVSLVEVFPDGSRSENLLSSGTLAERRMSLIDWRARPENG